MAPLVSGLFGGGGKGSAAADAEKSRQANRVAQERQLAENNRDDTGAKASRRAPRGRRLFEDAADTLGG